MTNVNVNQIWTSGENTIIIETPEGQPNVAITMWKHFGEHAGKVRAIDVTLQSQRNGLDGIVYHDNQTTQFDSANVVALQLPTECTKES